ncbi:MAG: leucine-rich repeat domain-containing protein, partial [Sphingobacteriales bacterium]|nr:leucine-rich repeat domain-containing protein [Sphingobacteriales bacterium]
MKNIFILLFCGVINTLSVLTSTTFAANNYVSAASYNGNLSRTATLYPSDTSDFYADRFALVRHNGQCYFIDKKGNVVAKLGTWSKAELFDDRDFAKVESNNNNDTIQYLLDTLGNTYRVAYNLKNVSLDITALDLQGQNLSTLPEIVCQQTQLKVLLLNGTKLTTLPISLRKLTNWPRLSYNQLTTLPESISKLTNLQTLYLQGNQLTTLPESISKLTKLQTLNLSYNQLTTLPESISKLTKLQTLNLSYNQLTTLPESISKLTKLQTLNLSYNQLTTLPESIS